MLSVVGNDPNVPLTVCHPSEQLDLERCIDRLNLQPRAIIQYLKIKTRAISF